MTLYKIANYAMQTTAAPAAVTTGAAIKTMLQLLTTATHDLEVVKWGVEFATAPTATVACELITTAAVAATVTAHAAAGVQPYASIPTGLATSGLTLSTTGTGYTATAEGTVAAVREADRWIAPIGVSRYDYEWSLGRGFKVPPSTVLRVRMTTATAINAFCYVIIDI